MTKLSRRKLDKKELGQYINNLWNAFTLATSKEDIKLLFKDLFTHTEYKMFAKRFQLARLLIAGNNYQAIEKQLKVTSHTIAKVNNILADRGDGLRRADKQLSYMENKKLEKQREYQKNLENPFRHKVNRKTVLGQLIKAGAVAADKKMSRFLKTRSAKKQLTI